MALGEAEHLAAERGQAAVVAVELVDEIFDLGGVELDAFDLGGELLAQLLVLLLVGGGEFGAGAERVEPRVLELGELLVEAGDGGELLERLRLELLFHLGERQRVVVVVVVGRLRLGAALDHVVLFVGGGFLFLGLFLFLDGRAGGLLADLGLAAAFAAFLALGDLLGRRALGQHRLEVEDLAQLHLAVVEASATSR